jgi:hypothetical protein
MAARVDGLTAKIHFDALKKQRMKLHWPVSSVLVELD